MTAQHNGMKWILPVAAWIYGIQVYLVVPWFLGAFYRMEQSPWPWIAFENGRSRHGLSDAFLVLYLYAIFYSVPVVLTFFLLEALRSRRPQPLVSSDQGQGMQVLLSLWVGYTFFLGLPAVLEFVRALMASLGLLGGWLFIGWLLVSLLAYPSLSVRSRHFLTNTDESGVSRGASGYPGANETVEKNYS